MIRVWLIDLKRSPGNGVDHPFQRGVKNIFITKIILGLRSNVQKCLNTRQ
jgi:hypothetical protein